MGHSLSQQQAAFAAYIRDPHNATPPAGVAVERMAMYRELFFNNIQSFLTSNFPVLFSLYDEDQAIELMQDFFARHRCQTPYFSEIAEEFLDYLANERQQASDFPFLWELAHYEWVEMALAIADVDYVEGDQDFIDQVLQRPLMLSPLACALAYRFPVQRICTTFTPVQAEQPSYLIVYRDREDQVKFMQTTAITWQLLSMLEQHGPLTGAQAVQQLLPADQNTDRTQAEQLALPILQELAGKGIIIPAV